MQVRDRTLLEVILLEHLLLRVYDVLVLGLVSVNGELTLHVAFLGFLVLLLLLLDELIDSPGESLFLWQRAVSYRTQPAKISIGEPVREVMLKWSSFRLLLVDVLDLWLVFLIGGRRHGFHGGFPDHLRTGRLLVGRVDVTKFALSLCVHVHVVQLQSRLCGRLTTLLLQLGLANGHLSARRPLEWARRRIEVVLRWLGSAAVAEVVQSLGKVLVLFLDLFLKLAALDLSWNDRGKLFWLNLLLLLELNSFDPHQVVV